MRSTVVALPDCMLVVALAACSSPNPALVHDRARLSAPSRACGPKVILLQQIAVERYLERLQIVRSSESYRLDVMSNDWWGEPLSAPCWAVCWSANLASACLRVSCSARVGRCRRSPTPRRTERAAAR